MTSQTPHASQQDSAPHPRPTGFDDRPRYEGQLDEKLGVQYVDYNPKHTVATMPVEGNLQPYGLMHGGASAALAESLGSTCAVLNAQPGEICVGVQVTANHHKSARTGMVTGVARPLHVGRSLKTIEITITNDQDEVVCTAQLIAMPLTRAPGEGKAQS